MALISELKPIRINWICKRDYGGWALIIEHFWITFCKIGGYHAVGTTTAVIGVTSRRRVDATAELLLIDVKKNKTSNDASIALSVEIDDVCVCLPCYGSIRGALGL